jgi:hypothetical protein
VVSSDSRHKQVTFIQSGGEGFLLKLLDPSIRTQVLDDTSLTFNDIDGRPLIFPNGNMPWRRLLATHSIIAHRHARDSGWLPSDELTAAELDASDLMEFSLDAEAQTRMKMFLKRPNKKSAGSKTCHGILTPTVDQGVHVMGHMVYAYGGVCVIR